MRNGGRLFGFGSIGWCRKEENYEAEAMNLLCNLDRDFPAHVAYIASHSRGVNRVNVTGKAIRSHYIEHYNL